MVLVLCCYGWLSASQSFCCCLSLSFQFLNFFKSIHSIPDLTETTNCLQNSEVNFAANQKEHICLRQEKTVSGIAAQIKLLYSSITNPQTHTNKN